MDQLTTYIRAGKDDKYSRFAWVMQGMFDEVLDEMIDRGTPDETLAQWFVYFGQIIEWCGSGDESVLPPHVRQFLAQHHPKELLAIEAPKEPAEVGTSVNA